METAGVRLVVEGGDKFSADLQSASGAAEEFNGVGATLGRGLGLVGGAAAGVAVAVGGAMVAGLAAGAASGLQLNNAMEQASAKINAFTKDGAATAEILEMVRDRAAKTPFAFGEMANSAAALIPVARAANEPLEQILETSEILAASNPAEGLEGAAFALREAVSGDFTSLIERFNLPRQMINQLKEEGLPNIEIVRKALQEMGFDYELVGNLANTAEGRMSTFQDSLQGIFAAATQPIFNAFSEGLGSANEKLGELTPMLTAAATAIGEALAPAAEWAAGAFVGLLEGVGTLVTIFSDQGLIGGMQTLGQSLLDWGVQMAGTIWQWVVDSVPVLLSNLAQAGQALINWAIESAPGWLATLQSTGQVLWQWILTQTPNLLNALIGFGQNILTWAVQMAPQVLGAVNGMREALIKWIVDALPEFGTNLGKLTAILIGKLGEWISFAGPKLLELAGIFLSWIVTDVLPKLPGQLLDIANALVTGIGNFISEVTPELAKLGQKFVDWVTEEVIPNIPGKLAEAWTAITNALNTWKDEAGPKAIEVGKAIVQGVIDGAKQLIGALGSALADIVNSALRTAKDALGIKSPSTVARDEIGVPVGQGVASGILASIAEVLAAADELSDQTLSALKSMADKAKKILNDILAGQIGFGRAQISVLDWIGDAEQRSRDLYAKAEAIEQKARDRQAAATKEQEEAAQKLLGLREQLAEQELTARQHYDPQERVKAEERAAKIREDIAKAEADARAKAEKAQAEQSQLARDAADARRRAAAATGPMEQARNLLEDAQRVAAQLAETDPQAARDYLALRQKQIVEFSKLQEARMLAGSDQERDLIDQQMEIMQQVHQQELEQLRRGVADRAQSYADAGGQAADGMVEAIRQALIAGGAQIGAALVDAITRALAGTPGGIAPVAPTSAMASQTNNFGGANVTINAANMSSQALEAMIRKVLQADSRSAAIIGRMA